MSNPDAAVLGQLGNDLHEFLATLLVHRRQRNTDQTTLSTRIESQIRLANGLLDRLELPLIIWSHDEGAWIWRTDAGDLVQLHLLAIDIDTNSVEHVWRRLARTDRGKFALGVLYCLVHRHTSVLQNLRNCHHDTRVPTGSPRTAFITAPGWLMFSTIRGRLFSLHSVTAV